MTNEAKLMSGIILLTVPTIQFGGFFLLRVLSGAFKDAAFTSFQTAMFRAGHAHAGVLVILSILCQLLIDHSSWSSGLNWMLRIFFPLSATLVSGGFFAAAIGKGITKSGSLVFILYMGVLILATSTILLGIGLIRP